MQLVIDAIKQVSSEIEILLYDHHKEDLSASRIGLIEARLREIWGGNYRITLCRRESASEARSSFWKYYVRPVMNFRNLYEYDLFAGSAQLKAFEECLARMPDYVFAMHLKCMPPVMQTEKKLPPVFVNLDDIEHLALQRSISQPPLWLGKRLQYLWVLALMIGERKAIRLSKRTFVCSDVDKRKLKRLFHLANIEAIPNAVSMPLSVPLASTLNLLLLGSHGYPPNRIGAEFFLDHVWPRVKAAVPDAVLIIAGPNSHLIRHSERPPNGVTFRGYVEDLNALYAETRIVVCPILAGSGTRVKIMEAAAYGKPIVSTTLGAEGIDFIDEKEILLRDDPEQFALACIDLLRDHDRACRMGERARIAIDEKYERSLVVGQLAHSLRED